VEILAQSKEEYEQKRLNDFSIQVRGDSRTLAVLAEYFLKAGLPMACKSAPALVKECMELMRLMILEGKQIEDYLSVEDARRYLESIGVSNLNPSGRNRQTYQRALLTERVLIGDLDPSYLRTRKSRQSLLDGKKERMKELRQVAEAAKSTIQQEVTVEVPESVKEQLVSSEDAMFRRKEIDQQGLEQLKQLNIPEAAPVAPAPDEEEKEGEK